MALTYDALASTTITNSTNSVEFTNLSPVHTDLIIIVNGQAHYPSETFVRINMRFNNDSGANYGFQSFRSTNYSASKGSGEQSQTSTPLYLASDASVNQKFNAVKIEINNYLSADKWKSFYTHSSALSQNSDKDRGMFFIGGTWRNTAPISSISFSNNDSATGFFTGTTFDLYGIKRA
jgi:hypothetical protein